MPHLLSDHPDWPNARNRARRRPQSAFGGSMTTPTPSEESDGALNVHYIFKYAGTYGGYITSEETMRAVCHAEAKFVHALFEKIAELERELTASQERIRELKAENAKLRGQVSAMLHDLESSEGLMCCDNNEGREMFELRHPSAAAVNTAMKEPK